MVYLNVPLHDPPILNTLTRGAKPQKACWIWFPERPLYGILFPKTPYLVLFAATDRRWR